MIRLNLTAYLESRGITLPRGFMQDADEALTINRTTLTKYLKNSHTVTSPDLRVLSELCEYLCVTFPEHLNFEDLFRGCFVWESFQTVFARSMVSFYVGALVPSGQSADEQMISLKDRSAVDQLFRLHGGGTELDIKFVPYQRTIDTEAQVSEAAIHFARELITHSDEAAPLAHVLIGSCKVHLLTILHLGDMFGVNPFEATNDRMPIGLIPRPGEVVPGCFLNTHSRKPGLLWRNNDNTWEHLGFEEDEDGIRRDAGLVIIDYHPESNELNIILFGFSGRGTKTVGRALARKPYKIEWPPRVRNGDALVDIYAFQFDFEATEEGKETETTIRRMEEDLLQQYFPDDPGAVDDETNKEQPRVAQLGR